MGKMILYTVVLFAWFMLIYFLSMTIKEGIIRVLKLYFIALTGWNKCRGRHRYTDAILAMKRLNYIFAKYALYRVFSL